MPWEIRTVAGVGVMTELLNGLSALTPLPVDTVAPAPTVSVAVLVATVNVTVFSTALAASR